MTRIRKAIIPVAGKGTRLAPITAVLPKAMLPLPWGDRGVLPTLHYVCSEVAQAGVEQLLLVISPSQRKMLEAYLEHARIQDHLPPLPGEIRFVEQSAPAGFGDAVRLGETFAAGEPVLVLLGDHVYQSDSECCCAGQVADAFTDFDQPAGMIGVQVVGEDELPQVGVARGEPIRDHLYLAKAFVEKPDLDLARKTLSTPGLDEGAYLAHGGIYAFSAEIFDCLNELAAEAGPGELQLTAAQQRLLDRHANAVGLYHFAGRPLDTGTPAGYAATFAALAHASI